MSLIKVAPKLSRSVLTRIASKSILSGTIKLAIVGLASHSAYEMIVNALKSEVLEHQIEAFKTILSVYEEEGKKGSESKIVDFLNSNERFKRVKESYDNKTITGSEDNQPTQDLKAFIKEYVEEMIAHSISDEEKKKFNFK